MHLRVLVKDTSGEHKFVYRDQLLLENVYISTLVLYVTGLRHKRLQTPSRDLERRSNFGGSNFHVNRFSSGLHRLRLEG